MSTRLGLGFRGGFSATASAGSDEAVEEEGVTGSLTMAAFLSLDQGGSGSDLLAASAFVLSFSLSLTLSMVLSSVCVDGRMVVEVSLLGSRDSCLVFSNCSFVGSFAASACSFNRSRKDTLLPGFELFDVATVVSALRSAVLFGTTTEGMMELLLVTDGDSVEGFIAAQS